jgi:alanine racemase
MAVVKSNGYGHGMLEVARAAVGAGAHSLGLARLDEALQLRAAGVVAPMLAMGGIPAGRWPEAVAADVQAAVWTREHVEAAAAAARQVQRPARLHLKVDTGMTRLGGFPEQAYPVAGLITAADDVIFEGVFTHLARADEADHRPTLHQLNVFGGLIARLEADSMRPPLIHAANTAAAITVPESRFDLVRCGIGLFGLSPSPECPLPSEFVPALSWKSRLSLVRQVPPGTGVSYGHAYVTRGSERIGVVPVGYGDGYRRTEGNQVLVRGRRVPVVGRVCMDQLMVGLDDIPDAAAGEEVVLIGRQSVEAISAEELAAIWGTIPYEVVCGVTSRVPRVYV